MSFLQWLMPNGRKRKIVNGLNTDVEYRDISVKVKLGRLLPTPEIREAIEDVTCRVHDILDTPIILL